jgi:hypothetical protein
MGIMQTYGKENKGEEMIEGFDHVGTDHQCNVCQCDFTDDEGGVQGYLGILPVAFCPTCFAGLCDMVGQLNDREWEGLTDEDRLELAKAQLSWEDLLVAAETKLKEKNHEGED